MIEKIAYKRDLIMVEILKALIDKIRWDERT